MITKSNLEIMKLRKKKLSINIDATLAVGLLPAAFCMFEMLIFIHKKTPIPPERMREIQMV